MTRNRKSREPRQATYARLVKRADAAFTAGDVKTCERLARQALAHANPMADAWLLLSASLLTRGKAARASRLLKKAVEALAPQTALLAYLLAVSYHRPGNPERAKPWFPLIAWDPELWEYLGEETDFELVRNPLSVVRPQDPAFG